MLTLKNHWYIAAPSADLRRDPIPREVEGAALVLFRDESERPRALLDRCAHRGMALSCGKAENGAVRCPYHGWLYGADGQVKDVPALEPGATRPRVRLHALPVVERDEHVGVWTGDDAPPGEPFHFPHHGEDGWSGFFMHNEFEAPLEPCLENFLDVPHTAFVHPGLFRSKSDRQPTRVAVRRDAEGVEAEFLEEVPLEGWGPRLVFPKGVAMRHTDRFVLPSTSRVDYRFGDEWAFVITSQCTQRAEARTAVTTAITWRLPQPAWLVAPFVKSYCRRVIRQDVDLLKVVGEQIGRFGERTVDTEADVLGRHIAALRREAAEGRAPQPTVEETTVCI